MKSLKDQKLEWEKLYKSFGEESIKDADFDNDFTRLIVIKKGITLNAVLDECKKRFTVSCYWDDLDKSITQNDRMSNQEYSILIKDTIEADKKYENMSANKIKGKDINGITLVERLLLEIKYFDETGNHLDINTITLCTGSRDSDGGVPCVYWNPDADRLGVYSSGPDDSGRRLCAREVVIL